MAGDVSNFSTIVNDGSDLDCPEYDNEDYDKFLELAFWLEGVIQTSIACCGILCNLGSSLILTTKEMRNSFNFMLIALSIFDIGYLAGSILESFRKSFHLVSNLHIYLFPYVLFPFQMIMMTSSTLMTVAIAMERYAAVHYPIDYNQSMNDERASLRRTLKHVVPVFAFSFLFNLPKFFEAEVTFRDSDPDTPILRVTELRKDPVYATYYSSWARCWVTGIIPFVLLVWFNTKIYQDIQLRRRRRCPRPRGSKSSERSSDNPFRPSQYENLQGSTRVALINGAATSVANNRAAASTLGAATAGGNGTRRKFEDNLAIIFMGIVLVFLVCHFPRILLSIHEMWIMEDILKCSKAGRKVFPLWALIFSMVSHLFLVINSSVNSLIYCILSSRFRLAVMKRVKRIGCLRSPSPTMTTLQVIGRGVGIPDDRINAGGRIKSLSANNNSCSLDDDDDLAARPIVTSTVIIGPDPISLPVPPPQSTPYHGPKNKQKAGRMLSTMNNANGNSLPVLSPKSSLTGDPVRNGHVIVPATSKKSNHNQDNGLVEANGISSPTIRNALTLTTKV